MLLEYIKRLDAANTHSDIDALYKWFWEQRDLIPNEMKRLNQQYGLTGNFELKPDLPCLSVGSVSGLVLLSMNPGWDEKLNSLENKCCCSSVNNYIDLMNNFFERYPEVVQKRSRWWAKPFWFTRLLTNFPNGFGHAASSLEKWQLAHSSRSIGGWELFPFHSKKDGITQYVVNTKAVSHTDLLRKCAKASVRAILRIRPKVLLVASKVGDTIVRDILAGDETFLSEAIANSKYTISSWVIRSKNGTTEVFSIPYQIFSAPRKFTNFDILNATNTIRQRRKGV